MILLAQNNVSSNFFTSVKRTMVFEKRDVETDEKSKPM